MTSECTIMRQANFRQACQCIFTSTNSPGFSPTHISTPSYDRLLKLDT